MKGVVVVLVLVVLVLVVLSGCAELYDADPAQAARADSSAAGYAVAMLETSPHASLDAAVDRSTPPVAMRRTRGDTAGSAPASRPGVARDASGVPDGVTARRDVASVAGPGADSTTASVAVAGRIDPLTGRDTAPRAGGVSEAPDVATLPASLSAPVDDSIVVNSFLAFNPAARTIWIDLIAGYTGANSSLNFNGGHAGSHTLVIPAGWRVEARFANHDHDLAHSVTVVRQIDPIPVMAPTAAFPGAFSIALEQGLVEGRGDVFRFSADQPGSYMILCAVPGHGQSGMWVTLEVSATAAGPEYRR